jgi:glycolate oxidase
MSEYDVIALRLSEAFGSDQVRVGADILPEYGCDESLHVEPVLPAAVFIPTKASQVATAIKIAAELGVPITARGAGTGLSGACVPCPNGLVISFEKMNSVLEIDVEGHVAVVEPGVTLADLDSVVAEHGLVYPVFPGTNAATIGGNVATNAGGMRAVKYGVTRRHVLGVEAITGTGDIIRTGGRFVKSSTGYDLTQLLVGTEGTLALITQATLQLQPRLSHSASILAPFATVDAVTNVVPKIVGSGVQPLVLEYIDRSTMSGLLRMGQMTLGVPRGIADKTQAYLVIVLEARDSPRLETDIIDVAEQLTEAGAHDVYVLPPGQGADLLTARENAFWMVKAAGADDLIDMVVPRQRIPEYLRGVQAIAGQYDSKVFGCGHAGDGNIHFSVYEADAETRTSLLRAIYQMGAGLGGVISGEHGIGRSKKMYFEEIEDPIKLALQRQIKDVFDPHGILNPGCVFDTDQITSWDLE